MYHIYGHNKYVVQNGICKLPNFIQNFIQILIYVQILSGYWVVFNLQTDKYVPISKSVNMQHCPKYHFSSIKNHQFCSKFHQNF